MSSTDPTTDPTVVTPSSVPTSSTNGSSTNTNHHPITIFERASIKLQEFRDRFYKAFNLNSSSSSLTLPQLHQRIVEILQTTDKYFELLSLNDPNGSRGFYREGIYRVPGSVIDTNNLYSQVFEGTEPNLLSRLQMYPEEVVASLVKKSLRQLNGILPLHVYQLIERWEELNLSPSTSDTASSMSSSFPVYRLENIRTLLNQLPESTKYIFGTLLQHLHHIVHYHNRNQMHPMAIAVVFAPLIFSTDNLDLAASMNIITIASHFLQYLLSLPLQELGIQNYILIRSNVLTMDQKAVQSPLSSGLRKKGIPSVSGVSAITNIDKSSRPLPQIPSTETATAASDNFSPPSTSAAIRTGSPVPILSSTGTVADNSLSTRELPPLVSPPHLNAPPPSPVVSSSNVATFPDEETTPEATSTTVLHSADIHERMSSLREQLDSIENRLLDLSTQQQSIEALINPTVHEIHPDVTETTLPGPSSDSTVPVGTTTVSTETDKDKKFLEHINDSLILDSSVIMMEKSKPSGTAVFVHGSKASRGQSIGESSSGMFSPEHEPNE